MIDYVNVRKPSAFKMWARKNRDSIKYGAIMAAVLLVSVLGVSWLQ